MSLISTQLGRLRPALSPWPINFSVWERYPIFPSCNWVVSRKRSFVCWRYLNAAL